MNAIITAGTGYTEADLTPFLASAQRACPDAKLFLIAYERDRSLIDPLRRKYSALDPVYIRRKFNRGGKLYRWTAKHFIDPDYATCGPLSKWVGRYSLHIMLERFYLAREIIQNHRKSLSKVLLTDSRDVVFQGDPFAALDGSLVSGLEEKTIGDCEINSAWITHVYGRDVYNKLRNRRIVCAGVTLGPIQAVERYLGEMCAEIWRCLSKVALIAQYDQGIHNFLIYDGRIPLRLTDNRDGIIATLHHEDGENVRADLSAGTIKVHGRTPVIVHQYDRHCGLPEFVRERFSAGEP